jgi:hypothetical protein
LSRKRPATEILEGPRSRTKNEKGEALAADLAAKNAAAKARLEKAAIRAEEVKARAAQDEAAAAELQKAEEEAAKALLEIVQTTPEPELLQEVARLNAQFIEREPAYMALRDPESIKNFELQGLTAFATALYTAEGVAKIKRTWGENGGLRRYFENYQGDQCRVVSPTFKGGISKCWLCGFAIPGAKARKRGEKPSGYSLECEHVFPIAQAIFFIDLHRGGVVSDEEKARLAPEYDWSHRVCNQIKNDDHFITVEGEGNNRKWVITGGTKIRDFLRKIYDRSSSYFAGTRLDPNRLQQDIKDVEAWITEREPILRVRFQSILDSGGASFCAAEGAPDIFTMIQVAKCFEIYDERAGLTSRASGSQRALSDSGMASPVASQPKSPVRSAAGRKTRRKRRTRRLVKK